MAVSAFGATISVASTALAEVVSIGVPSLTGGVIDVTTHASPDRYREFIRELRDAGEFSVTMMYTAGSTTDDACVAAINSDTATTVTLTAKAASGTEEFTISAFGINYEVADLEIDAAQTATLTLKPTGKPTQAPDT
jgi:acyl-CoA synthetase (NDP forming)